MLLQQQHIEDASTTSCGKPWKTSSPITRPRRRRSPVHSDVHSDDGPPRGLPGNLFTPEWGGKLAVMNIVIGTCTDYLEDLKQWIVDHYFAKVVRELFDQIMARYVEGMLLHARPRGRFWTTPSPARISKAMRNCTFFRGYAGPGENGHPRTACLRSEAVEILYWITKILSKPNLEELLIEDATMQLVEYFEDRGVAVATLVRSCTRAVRARAEKAGDRLRLRTAWNASRRAVQTAAKGLKGAVHVGRRASAWTTCRLHADTVTKHEMGPERFCPLAAGGGSVVGLGLPEEEEEEEVVNTGGGGGGGMQPHDRHCAPRSVLVWSVWSVFDIAGFPE